MQLFYRCSVCGLAALLLAVMLGINSTSAMAAQPDTARTTVGQIVVRFKDGTTSAERQRVITAIGARADSRRSIGKLSAQTLLVVAGTEDATIARLNAEPQVAYAARIHRKKLDDVPNDPSFKAANRNAEAWGYDAINAPRAWSTTTGSSNVLIAVIDSGLDVSHPDIAGRVVLPEPLGWSGAPYPSDTDKYTHGTHVAGIAAAAGNNGVGMAGVAWGVKVMPIRVFDYPGSPDDGQDSMIAQAIVFAVDHGAQIINMSLGGGDYSQIEADACAYAWRKGAFVVAAAGNNGRDEAFYPASYDYTVGVAATDRKGVRAGFSNYGSLVDLAAPGVSIYSLLPVANGSYGYKNGTSMATPYVAGVAALLKSIHPDYSPDQILTILKTTATDLGAAGRDDFFGAGQIDADAALRNIVPLPHGTLAANGKAHLSTTDPQLTLNLAATAQMGVTRARVSNRSDFSLADEFDYDGTPLSLDWNLTDSRYGGKVASGTRRVYVQYQDSLERWSAPVSVSVYLRVTLWRKTMGVSAQNIYTLTSTRDKPSYVSGTLRLASGKSVTIPTITLAPRATQPLDLTGLLPDPTVTYTLRLVATARVVVQRSPA